MSRVLIIDDASFMRGLIRRSLEHAGIGVAGEAGDGGAGIDLYAKLRPDAVTLDLIMPSANGLAVLERLRELDAQARVVVVSAIDQRASLMRAVHLGVADYVVKPFEPGRLVAAVTRALALAR